MNLIELNNLQPRVMTPPSNIFDRILASLYYGYSINRACYSGVSKKYIVKSSNIKGSIENSSYDYIDKKPDFIIYNTFMVNKDIKKEEFSLVSEVNFKEFGQFLDLNEIKKKLD